MHEPKQITAQAALSRGHRAATAEPACQLRFFRLLLSLFLDTSGILSFLVRIFGLFPPTFLFGVILMHTDFWQPALLQALSLSEGPRGTEYLAELTGLDQRSVEEILHILQNQVPF